MQQLKTDSFRKWQVLAMNGIAVIFSMTTWFSATAVLPELTLALNLSPAQAGWLTNAVQAGFVVGALISSLLALADIMPMTRLMGISAACAALANVLLLLEPSLGLAICARFLTGAALAGVYPPAMKFIATWFQTGRGLAMGAMVGALTLGSAMPHLVRGLGGSVSWQWVIGLTSFACLFSALIFVAALREGPHPFARTKVDPRQIGRILKNRPVMLANCGYFGHMWELYAMWGWLLAYTLAAEDAGQVSVNASLLVFAVIALGGPGSFLAGWLADRIGRCATTSLMMITSGSCALLIGLSFDGPTWFFCVVAAIWGLTIVSDSAQFSAAVTELADQSLVGSALAFQMGIGFAITIVSVWLVPQIAAFFGSWQWALLILVPGPALGTIAMLSLRRTEASLKLAQGKR